MWFQNVPLLKVLFLNCSECRNLPWGEKKKGQKFFKISQPIFIAQCRFFFHNVLQGLKFFYGTFWGCTSACNADFHAFFAFRPLKRGLKTPRWPQNSKFHHVKVSPKALHYMISGSHARYFFRPKGFFGPTTQNNIFWSFLDPQFSKKKYFWFKKNQRLNGFIDLKISFYITFLHVLNTT